MYNFISGNVVIIGSTLCPRLRPLPATPTNVFLGGLATADLLLILFCIPVKVTVPRDILTNLDAPLHCKPVHAGLFRSYARLTLSNVLDNIHVRIFGHGRSFELPTRNQISEGFSEVRSGLLYDNIALQLFVRTSASTRGLAYDTHLTIKLRESQLAKRNWLKL
ncbi:hypothetical protein WN51_02936 [Melipona quadrifasciata]|uniref:Uncharacterized protein n=1 Tax=Melipona quadrifasciata TaxID=166423 RepID=A0A0M9A8Z9_9HYME|nr:hypothetical protein WN51_02936 [Melipona quadrifasciata]